MATERANSTGERARAPGAARQAMGEAARPTPGNHAMGRLLAMGGEGIPGARHARQAVAGAVAGRLPFAQRIFDETGGRVDARRVPAAVVPGLPSRGVALGGRIALRPDAGIEVARHELGHVLGGDEYVARRAERDPTVLASMVRGAPRDGWDRDPRLNYLRLYFEDLYVDVSYDPTRVTDSAEVKSALLEARTQVATILSKREVGSVDWQAFEHNVSEWIASGYSGMFPLWDAFAGKQDAPLALDEAHGDGGSVGQENELRSAVVEGVDIKYDDTLAQTKAVSPKVEVEGNGVVKRVASRWPLLRVSVDQVKEAPPKKEEKDEKPPPKLQSGLTFTANMFEQSRGKLKSSARRLKKVKKPLAPKSKAGKTMQGIVELIFGPSPSSEPKAPYYRAKATSLFQNTVLLGWGEGGLPFGDFAQAYNTALEDAALADPPLADYQIEVAKPDVLIGCRSIDKASQHGDPPTLFDLQQSIQTSVEVSSVKLGDVADTSFLALWDDSNDNEAVDRRVFQTARSEARTFVDRHLRPIVSALSAGVYDAATLDMSRLYAVFTLALFQLAKAADAVRKGASPVMEKAGFGDQLREILDAREKAAVWQLAGTSDGTTPSEAFTEPLLDHAARVWEAKQWLSKAFENRVVSQNSQAPIAPLAPLAPTIAPTKFPRTDQDVRQRLYLFTLTAKVTKNERRYGSTFGRRDDDPRYVYPEAESHDPTSGMKWDFRGRQRVQWGESTNKGGTSAGKPIRMTHHIYHGRGLIHRDPRFVVEVRGADNQINTFHEHFNRDPELTGSLEYPNEYNYFHDLARNGQQHYKDRYERLYGASRPPSLQYAPGPDPRVKPQPHGYRYPDEEQQKPRQFRPLLSEVKQPDELKPQAPLAPIAPMPSLAPMPSRAPVPLRSLQSAPVLPNVAPPMPPVLAPPPVPGPPPLHWRPRPGFDNPLLVSFVLDLAMGEIGPSLPSSALKQRQLRAALRRLIVSGRYGPVASLGRIDSPRFEHLIADAGVIIGRLR